MCVCLLIWISQSATAHPFKISHALFLNRSSIQLYISNLKTNRYKLNICVCVCVKRRRLIYYSCQWGVASYWVCVLQALAATDCGCVVKWVLVAAAVLLWLCRSVVDNLPPVKIWCLHWQYNWAKGDASMSASERIGTLPARGDDAIGRKVDRSSWLRVVDFSAADGRGTSSSVAGYSSFCSWMGSSA